MAMRSLPLANQYESILPSWVYDTPDPTSLPIVLQEQLESVMRKYLDNALQKAVAWARLVQRDPSLVTKNTYITRNNNLLMFPMSAGSNITLELFKILFAKDVVIPRQLGHSDPNGETIPDFSELLLTDFIDQRVQQLIPDETFKELAQDLHMTLNESASL